MFGLWIGDQRQHAGGGLRKQRRLAGVRIERRHRDGTLRVVFGRERTDLEALAGDLDLLGPAQPGGQEGRRGDG